MKKKFIPNIWVKFTDDNGFECIGRCLIICCIKYISYIDTFGNHKMVDYDSLSDKDIHQIQFKKTPKQLITETQLLINNNHGTA